MLITKRLAEEQSGAEVAGLEDRDLRCRIGAGAPSVEKACFLSTPRSLIWLGLTRGGARRAAAVQRQCGGSAVGPKLGCTVIVLPDREQWGRGRIV